MTTLNQLQDLNLHLLPPEAVTKHLQSIQTTTPHAEITTYLLTNIQTGLFPPQIFKIWFRISPTTPTILAALSQTFSASIRRAGLKVLWKLLHSNSLTKWTDTWESIGGVPGILKIFSEASVSEVKFFSRVISWSTKLSDPPQKREGYTQLLKSLCSDRFSDAEWKNPDDRKLDKFYALVGKACTAEFIEQQAKVENTWSGDYEWKDLMETLVWKGYAGYFEYSRLQTDLQDFPRGEEWINLYMELYPSLSTTADGICECLKFSPELLKEIQERDWKSKIRNTSRTNYVKKPESFVAGIIYPLTQRAYKLKSSPEIIRRILDLSLSFVEEHKNVATSIKKDTHDLLDLTIIAWAATPETFESYLRTFLKLYYPKNAPRIDGFTTSLARVPISLRYQLLQICIKETRDLDIDNDQDLEKLKPSFGNHFLSFFPAETAYSLYTRLKTIKGNTKFLNESDSQSILSLKVPDQPHADSDIWQIHFLHKTNQQAAANELALTSFTARKSKAASSSTPQLRAIAAREAIYYTIASGSPTLYCEAMEWIKQRFIRDSFVVSYIFENETREGLNLIVGIPENLEAFTTDTLFERITECNKLLETLYETAFLAAKEPSFNIRNWYKTLRLIPSVIEQRMKATRRVKDSLGITDEATYEILWKDLTQLIIKVEEKGLQTGYENLNLHTIRGVLYYNQHTSAGLTLTKSTPLSTYLFFNDLSKARDKLWHNFRPTIHTTTTLLPKIFPSGLPIQTLIAPYTIQTTNLEEVAPYIYSRAKQAVFLPPDSLTPIPSNDDETWTSIGPFIDDYGTALRLLVPETTPKDQRKDRLTPIFMHGITTLSGNLPSSSAPQFWKHFISTKISENHWTREKWQPIIHEILDSQSLDLWPTIPNNHTDIQESEWNPQEGFTTPLTDLPQTYLTLSLTINSQSTTTSTIHTKPAQSTPKLPAQDEIWSSPRITRALQNPLLKEAQILSAILYIKSYFSIDHTISIIPKTLHPRFPLEPQLKKIYHPHSFPTFTKAITALTIHKDSIPPTILQNLTAAALKHSKPDIAATTNLISLLSISDNPSLSTPFSISIILNNPDSSSWHRHLLNSKYLSTLPTAAATETITKFAEEIIQILEDNEKLPPTSTITSPSEPPPPPQQQAYVKITTIKQLSTLLTHPSVSPTTAVSTLSLLTTHCTHIDIQKSLLDSLTNILLSTTSHQLALKTIKALKFTIPVAGNLNNRSPITEEKWLEAETKKDVSVLNTSIENIRNETLLYTILSTASLRRETFKWKDLFTTNISIAILQELKLQTSRYLSIFLTSHGFTQPQINAIKIPVVPGTWRTWYTIIGAKSLETGAFVPRHILEELASYMIFRISLPQELIDLGKKLKQKEWADKPGVRFWNEEYGGEVLPAGMPVDLKVLKSRKEYFEKMGLEGEVVREEMMRFLVGGLYFGM